MTPEEYVKSHQKAFRLAFDFLNTHFPPGNDEEWWVKAAQDASLATISAGETPLSIQLMIGVVNYLDDERRKRYEAADD